MHGNIRMWIIRYFLYNATDGAGAGKSASGSTELCVRPGGRRVLPEKMGGVQCAARFLKLLPYLWPKSAVSPAFPYFCSWAIVI